MPLQPGDKLGPYEIIAPIGKGGMGEVYRALDPRMGREVAIKVSTEQFSERFSREVRAIAALNHPNVCTMHDVGPNFLVMELVEGPTLAERIREGAIPLEESLHVARQIADALEAAHEKDITHRDLKPGNIKIKPDGTVKVLDFGLAKVGPRTASGGEHNPEESPTISMAATQAGVILGTAAYMAPEQARGKEVDRRADIWAFGVVLYEMVTGQRLFRGEDLTDTLAAVVRDKADVSAAPPRLRHLLEACLKKEPKQRLRDIADVRFLLEEPPVQMAAASAPQPRASRLGWIPWAAAAVAILAAAALGFGYYRATRPAPLQPMVRLDVDLGSDVSLASVNGSSNVILSPDATRLVYIASLAGGPPILFIRRFDQPTGTELPGTQNPRSPFFSPDGQWVGFTSNGKLSKISVEGGAVVPLRSDAANVTGASWGEDGNIVHGILLRGLFSIPAGGLGGGGDPAPLLEVAKGEIGLMAPQILPEARAVLFTAYLNALDPDKGNIDVLSLPDHRRKTVVRGGVSARYLASSNGGGYLLYANRATLFAVPFDLEKLETRGTALPVLDDVAYSPTSFESQFDVSRDGTLVYRKANTGAGSSQLTTIQWLDAAGKRQPLVAQPAAFFSARLSPDGKRLAAAVGPNGALGIQVYDLQRETWSKLTFDRGRRPNAVWSPDGRYVVFGSTAGLQWTRADGSGQPQPLTSGNFIQTPGSFSPDGKRVTYYQVGGQASSVAQIWSVPVEENGAGLKAGTAEQFLKSQFNDQFPVLSPDGKWLAYASVGQGTPEVYVRAFPDNGGLWKISTNGGTNPVWSRGAHELFYQAGNQIMAVGYSVNGSAFVPDKSRVLAAQAGGLFQDLSPDGKRAVILSPVGTPETPKTEHEVVLIQNFLDELRRKLPLGK